MAPASGIGLSLKIRFGFRHGFVFRDLLRFWTFVWTFGKALRMQECAIVLGSCSFY